MALHGLVPSGNRGACAATTGRRSTERRATRRVVIALAAFATASCLAATASGAGSTPPPRSSSIAGSLDAATRRALELQQSLENLQAEQTAIQLRLDANAVRIREQDRIVSKAQAEAERAQEVLRSRVVAIYKSSEVDAIALLAGSASWTDLVTRATLITRMLETDSLTLREAEDAAERARREAEALARLRKDDLVLRELHERRVASARTALAEQKRVVATLSEEARRILAASKASGSRSQKQWKNSSLPGGTRIPKVPVTVQPYSNITFLAADYAPKRFRATGQTFSGLASWYGKAVDGHRTASGRIFNHEDFTTAHRSLPFGTWLAVTRGDKRVIVVVTDRGPYVGGRVLDLSEAAAQALGIGGVKTVNAEVVVPQ